MNSIGLVFLSFRTLVDKGYCIVGSVETVRRRLSGFVRVLGFGLVMPLLQIANMPHDRTMKNMELFANKVIPPLREEFKEMHDKWTSAA
jgi:hypothetical protein